MLCFGKIAVAKCLSMRGGEYQNFPSKNFFPTVPKNFVEETFRVS